jgi:tRNA/tmRNA/rRNA uracil-C5-methylase (TrmA/RlmC/RlmD family)
MYGGAKWLTIGYDDQLKIKEGQVREAFYHILKYISEQNPPNPLYQGGIDQDLSSPIAESDGLCRDDKTQISKSANQLTFHPIIPSPEIYGYRNKVEFSWGKYISARENIHDDFRFGFHAQGQFDRIENCTYCALADEETNEIFRTVDILSRASGLSTYDPKTGDGFWRHFVVRKGNKE